VRRDDAARVRHAFLLLPLRRLILLLLLLSSSSQREYERNRSLPSLDSRRSRQLVFTVMVHPFIPTHGNGHQN
jgi:hypothetical protein